MFHDCEHRLYKDPYFEYLPQIKKTLQFLLIIHKSVFAKFSFFKKLNGDAHTTWCKMKDDNVRTKKNPILQPGNWKLNQSSS